MPTEITPRTRFAITISAALLIASALVTATWTVSTTLHGIQRELEQINRQIGQATSERWTAQDQQRWAILLERDNRSLGLIVPDPLSPSVRVRSD